MFWQVLHFTCNNFWPRSKIGRGNFSKNGIFKKKVGILARFSHIKSGQNSNFFFKNPVFWKVASTDFRPWSEIITSEMKYLSKHSLHDDTINRSKRVTCPYKNRVKTPRHLSRNSCLHGSKKLTFSHRLSPKISEILQGSKNRQRQWRIFWTLTWFTLT